PFGLHRLGIQIHLNLALFAAVGVWNRNTWDGDKTYAHEVLPEVAQLLLGESLARKSQLQNGNRRSVVLNDERGVRPRGHGVDGRLSDGRNLCDRNRYLNARLKEDLHDRASGERLRFNVLDIVHRGGQRTLEVIDDAI